MNARAPYRFALGLLVVAILGACSEQSSGSVEHSETTARLVTHMTSGEISTTSPIRVVFRRDMVPDSQVGDSADSLMELSPRIGGSWFWETPRAISFQPERPLPLRTTFDGTLDLEAAVELANISVEGRVEPASFRFTTLGREITSFSGDFELVSANDPSQMFYVASIGFNDPPEQARFERAISVTYDDRRVEFSLESAGEPGQFELRTARVTRDNAEHTLIIDINEGPVELTGDVRRVVTIPPIEAFTVQEVIAQTDESETGLQIAFSDELSSGQDLTGLIRTVPEVELRFRRANRTVIAHGEFELGQRYRVVVGSGIRSVWGTRTTSDYTETVEMSAIRPRAEWVSKGAFLPTSGEGNIYLKTVNLRRATVTVQQVYENNLGQFLQTEQLASSSTRNDSFNSSYVNRVGVTVAEQELDLGEEENRWLIHELDLSTLLGEAPRGLFLVRVSFERDDMIWDHPQGNVRIRGDEYYTNPSSWGYLYRYGSIYKPVVVSDIGLTWKRTGEEHLVIATNVLTGEPLANVELELRTYQQQLVVSGRTNNRGIAQLPRANDEVFYLTGTLDDQRSVIKANEMGWNLSTFDTGGEETSDEGVQAFIYAERGVHRPGDQIQLSAILRNQEGTFPEDHPVRLKLINPRGQTYLERTLTEAEDGFYATTLETNEEDPTGTWRLELEAGDGTFTKDLPIETIVPNRLDVQVQSDPARLGPADRSVRADVAARYLFGASAAGLEYELEATLENRPKRSNNFPGFTFSNEATEFTALSETVAAGTLDGRGGVWAQYTLPATDAAPSALDLVLDARVLEPGGRATRGRHTVAVEPYTHYAGFAEPDMPYGFARIAEPLQVPVISINTEGEGVAGRELEYRLYHNRRWWWWHYDSYEEFRVRYKSSVNTELLQTGSLVSASRPSVVSVTPETWGQYLLEVEDVGSGHIAGFFFRGSSWTSAQPGYDEGVLGLSVDRDEYAPGDTAVVRAATPDGARMLVAIEKANEVIETRWVETEEGETEFEVDITEEMLPNIYVSVSLQQPHAQTANDRPIRMYGIVPIRVVDPDTEQSVTITTADRLAPNEEFTVGIQTDDGEPTQFTIAVVDEGLLNITDFETPDPWAKFFAKQRLNIKTFDQYGQIIGAMTDDVFRTFSIGGGDGDMGPDDSDDDRRFEPVALFAGPMMTERDGSAEVTFTMPNYMGEVRVMVVHANGNRYGSAERSVTVSEDIVILPTLPRVLGPGEQIALPVNLFSTIAGDQPTRVTVETEGPITVEGEGQAQVALPGQGSAEVEFSLTTERAVGRGRVTVRAVAGGTSVETSTPIEIRASSPPIRQREETTVERGRAATLAVPAEAIRGSEELTLSVSSRPNLNLQHRLSYLISYPYGCIEQTVSAGFPQLYLADFLPDETSDNAIDDAIRATIDRLRSLQLPSGGFGFWPGSEMASPWGTNYAGHFLIVARDRGYPVSTEMLEQWIRFQNSRAIGSPDASLTNIYRLYLLALAGEPAVGAMNIQFENQLESMNDTERWLLAAAYSLAGMDQQSRSVLRGAGVLATNYDEYGETFGSRLRDRAMILDAAVAVGRADVADRLFADISEDLAERNWYSTHTVGYSLVALGRYIDEMVEGSDRPLAGTITLPGGGRVDFESESLVYTADLTDEVYDGSNVSAGDQVRVELERNGPERAYVTMHWSGQPLVYLGEDRSQNMSMELAFLNEQGQEIDPAVVEQGDEFWLRIRVTVNRNHYNALNDIALTQILPSGWEIVNTRLTGESLPSWMSRYNFAEDGYVDMRDDRINWFFDSTWRNRTQSFVVKLQAVTAGTFTLPPTTVETMYDDAHSAMVQGREVRVQGR
ncbi:MAG: alpha-2-macroglobulin family protein [Spirochaetales bacterium]